MIQDISRSSCPLALSLIVASALFIAPSAYAEPQWLGSFTSLYPSATRLATCGVCHRNFVSNSPGNAYGNAFASAGGSVTAALRAIEGMDSDGDGTLNLDEITMLTGFMPGYTCDTYTEAMNAPADLADYVDPNNVGCATATTTTTVKQPSTCGQPVSKGPLPTATDCLFILQTAVFIQTCEPACVCAPKGTLPASATDALICLKKATGQSVPMDCPCVAPTTTTSTTTLAPGGDPVAGQAYYDQQCASCHRAGSHDPSGFFSDLAGDGNLLVNDLGTLDSMMAGMMMSDQEILDLAAFLDSL